MTRICASTFTISEVLPARRPLAELPYPQAVVNLLGNKVAIEACSRYHGRLVAGIGFHPVIAALHQAVSDHRPVCLSPDMVWLMIAQGAANHINVHSETLRPRFVQHQGKVKLIVRRDDFVAGSPENPWAEVFPEFTEQIRGHVGDATHDFFVANYSTTGV